MAGRRKTVGYIRSITNLQASCEIQKGIIERYSRDNDIPVEKYYCDLGFRKCHREDELNRVRLIGFHAKKWFHVYEAWENMMLQIASGLIDTVLVDTKIRLYDGIEQKKALDRLCYEHGVTIIETGSYQPAEPEAMDRLIIYHYTIEPDSRTNVALKDIDSLYGCVSQRLGRWGSISLYLDLSSSKRSQFEKMLSVPNGSIILVKNLFHIKRKMMPFLTVAKQMEKKNVNIISMEEGILEFNNEKKNGLFEKHLKTVIYDRHRSFHEEETNEIQIKKFQTFVSVYTGWSIEDIFIDSFDCCQKQQGLGELVKKAASGIYDIMLIDTYGKVGDTVIEIARVMKKLNIPIYSLREGGLELHGEW